VPRILCDAREVAAGPYDPGVAGAVWKLEMSHRHLDSDIIRLPPESRIDAHTGPDLDVLILVLDGGGELVTETGTLLLHPGALAWLPRLSRREITASVAGLSYLTVHPRRPPLGIEAASSARLSGPAAQRPCRAGRRTGAARRRAWRTGSRTSLAMAGAGRIVVGARCLPLASWPQAN
jgi:hypothetical protein